MENKRNSRNVRSSRTSRTGKTNSQGNLKNKKGTKKFTNTRLFKILRIVLLIAIIVIIFNIVSGIIKNRRPEDISLIIGDSKIELANELLIDENKNIYISKDDIAAIYDPNIYYNDEEKTLITTYNKHVAKLVVDQTTMEVNSSQVAINGTLKYENDILYMPFLDLKDVYDFEYQYNEDRNVLIVDSISKEKSQAVVVKSSKIKKEPKTFSGSLEKISKFDGVYVTIFGTEGDYTKVRTPSGNIGYIKTNKLGETEIVRENMGDDKLDNVNILSDYNIVGVYDNVTVDSNKTNIVIPSLFNINQALEVESVIDLSSSSYSEYKNWAETNGISICANVTLTGSMNEICSSYTSRTCLINLLYNQFVSNKINMICIDFDNIDDIEGFYRFVIELTPRFKEVGFKVLVKYKDGLDKERLENIVDYVIEG